MRTSKQNILPRLLASLLAVSLTGAWMPHPVGAQTPVLNSPTSAPLTQEQLSSLVAPIALYPDPLVSQILMASTYPLAVAEAASWQNQNSSLTGPALNQALQTQTWDPSVKSLVSVPQVLQMMSANLSWVQNLGDAVLAQQPDVLAAIQALRFKAQQAGNLSTNPQQTVTTTEAAGAQVIVIQPADPQVVYVPIYNPAEVYGPWPYPAEPPPPPYYPSGYIAGAALLSFGVGAFVGSALFGGMNWGGHGYHGSITIHQNDYNRFNTITGHRTVRPGPVGSNGAWQFNPRNRGKVPYPNPQLHNRYRANGARPAAPHSVAPPAQAPRVRTPIQPRPGGQPNRGNSSANHPPAQRQGEFRQGVGRQGEPRQAGPQARPNEHAGQGGGFARGHFGNFKR